MARTKDLKFYRNIGIIAHIDASTEKLPTVMMGDLNEWTRRSGCLKDFAKRSASSAEGPLPREIATVLYYAAIAAAGLRCHARITILPDGELQRGLEWAIGQSWLDDETLRAVRLGVVVRHGQDVFSLVVSGRDAHSVQEPS